MYSEIPRAAAWPSNPRPRPRVPVLQVLTADEAAFIDAAMSRLFPGGIGESEGSVHVDRKLRGDAAAAALYRCTIAQVQAHCLQVYDRRFQSLCPRQQDVVLMQLEEGCQQLEVLFHRLLDDSTEVFLTGALWPLLP